MGKAGWPSTTGNPSGGGRDNNSSDTYAYDWDDEDDKSPRRSSFAPGWGLDHRDTSSSNPHHQRNNPPVDSDDAQVQYISGNCYLKGMGVPTDYAKAENWFRRAADQGHARAQYELGAMHAKGQGARVDFVEAGKWFIKAADQRFVEAASVVGAQSVSFRKVEYPGHPQANFCLGIMYANGEAGVAQDLAEAYFRFALAGALGNADAVKFRDQVETKLCSDVLLTAKLRLKAVLETVPEGKWLSTR